MTHVNGMTRSMRTRKVRAAEDDDDNNVLPQIDHVALGTINTITDRFDQDIFAQPAKSFRTKPGLSPAMKKSAGRLEKKFEGVEGTGSKQLIEETTGYLLFDVAMTPYNMTYLAQLFDKSSPHASAVRAKVSNIVGLGYEFIESPKAREKTEKTSTEEATAKLRRKLEKVKVELEEWLESRNQEDTFDEVLRKVWTDYEVTGNGYIEIGRTAGGDIGYIGHLPATSVRVRRLRDGFVQIVSEKAAFFRNFGDRTTPDRVGNDPRPNEVIHLKKYSPNDGYYGVPEIISAMDGLAGNEFSSKFNLDYFEHRATPRYVVVIKGATLGSQNEKKVAEFFEGSLKGKNHRTLVVPLPPDSEDIKTSFEMKPVEAGKIDASFINYRKENLNEILMAHRVPISKVGLAEGVSLAVARDADKTFKEQVCRPEQRVLEKKLNRIFKEKTDIFLLKLKELTLTDEDTLSKMDERYLRMKVMVPNEVRKRWGWPGIEGGDKPVELKPEAATEQRAQAGQTRTRDADRSANATDGNGEGRNAKGEGRAQT